REQLRRVIALYGVDIRLTACLLQEGLAECDVLRIVEPVAVVQRSLDALGGLALCLQRALSQEAIAAQRYLEARGCVLLHKLHRSATGEEGADDIDLQARNLRQQRLEVRL